MMSLAVLVDYFIELYESVMIHAEYSKKSETSPSISLNTDDMLFSPTARPVRNW